MTREEEAISLLVDLGKKMKSWVLDHAAGSNFNAHSFLWLAERTTQDHHLFSKGLCTELAARASHVLVTFGWEGGRELFFFGEGKYKYIYIYIKF